MRIVVTGAGGQLGKEIINWPNKESSIEIIGLTRAELDIINKDRCVNVLESLKPDIIIHCAAYTAVDQAESDSGNAFLVNRDGTRNVAIAAQRIGCKLCYISTDYVFDGRGVVPYNTDSSTNPQTIYGKSKLAGELAVRELVERYYIVRTSWVFGKYGANFVETMLRISAEKDSIKVVSDQIGAPTYTFDLAEFLLKLVESESYGTFHVSNAGVCSWYEFAKTIFEYSGAKISVFPCSTEEFPRPAPRPLYSVMSPKSIEGAGLSKLRPWQEALQHYLNQRID
jgi:dTDP-4-dehydrorhamnose reductase